MLIILSEREYLTANKCVYIKVRDEVHYYTLLSEHILSQLNCMSAHEQTHAGSRV